MRWSLWTQKWEYQACVPISAFRAYAGALLFYQDSGYQFSLISDRFPETFCFERGSVFNSLFPFASELNLKHYVTVSFSQVGSDHTRIDWEIDLKLCGLQTGQNDIIEECKELLVELA